MEFLFERLTREFMSKHRERVRCRVEHEKRNSALNHDYKNMYYCVYHRNTIALYCEEKLTSLMNENKLIDNLRITIVECVCAKS